MLNINLNKYETLLLNSIKNGNESVALKLIETP